MSGGVDSSVAAALLKESGYEVAGATIRTWASGQCADLNTRACCGLSGVEDARDVADSLGIPYWVFNFEEEFKKHVVDIFAGEYLRGRTPNPCLSCNEHIKFRLFLQRARQLGYDAVATGHYAQMGYDYETSSYYICQGRDAAKDQSYVLFPLEQELLQNLLLPVGGFTKSEIRDKAKALGLRVWGKPDSQEICFIPSNRYGEFLQREFMNGETKPGVIRHKSGKILGEHEGYYHYTRGQRRGLGVANSERLYVIRTDPQTNEVFVGNKEDILGRSFRVSRVNWFLPPGGGGPILADVRIRSQHKAASAELFLLESGDVKVVFEEPQEAITPGQGVAFYRGQGVIGGGWVEEVWDDETVEEAIEADAGDKE
ncbi:MAG: tRNA 2-thiouridine(34) synthase MnmA [Omnitrophica bacterium GWA2_52_8]|nr:MAG: tRNA 2-thiouridine(34) synthase MnmA [Omnitrophica bacterium GWA2_52_8]